MRTTIPTRTTEKILSIYDPERKNIEMKVLQKKSALF